MPLLPIAVNDAFRNVTIGGTTISAEQVGDTLTLAGTGIVFTTDASTDTVTITNSGGAGVAGNVSVNPDTTNTSRYLIFTAGTSGNEAVYSDTDITYNPSTNVLTAGSFSGGLSAANLSGTIPSSVLTNSTVYIGTTAIGLDRISGAQTLTGVSIDGNAGTATTAGSATSAGTATKSTNLVGGNSNTLLGSIPYQSNTDTTSLLSPNTTATKKFLRMTGDGANGSAPAWDTIVAGDIPTLNQNTSGTALGLSGSQVANYFYAGPTTGPAATASWRAIVAGDIPTLNQNTSGTATTSTNLIGGNNTTLLGSLPYQSNTNITTLLSPNTTTTKKFLRMTGDGTNGANPAWDTVTASDVGLSNVTNESKATMFTSPTFTGVSTVSAISVSKIEETFDTKTSATGVVVHDCSVSHIFRHTSISANFTANFTNLDLESSKGTNMTLILVQDATARLPTAVQIGGVAQTILWQGSAQPLANNNKTDVVTFSILNVSGAYTVLGALSTFGS